MKDGRYRAAPGPRGQGDALRARPLAAAVLPVLAAAAVLLPAHEASAEQGAVTLEVGAGSSGIRSESPQDGLWGWGATAEVSAEARYAFSHQLELGLSAGAHPGAWVRLEGGADPGGHEGRAWRARTAWGAGVARLYVAGLRWRLFALASLGLSWVSSDEGAAAVTDGEGVAWIPFDAPPSDRLAPRATAGVGLEHAWDTLAAGVRLEGGLAFPEAPQVGLRFHLAWSFYP